MRDRDPMGYFDKAVKSFEKNDFDNAIRYFTLAISIDSYNPELFNFRGFAYSCKGNLDNAI